MRLGPIQVSFLLMPALLMLGGCAVQQSPINRVPGASLSGVVHGGNQPVTGSTIQLYAAGTGGYGSTATPLLASPVFSGDDGSFNLNSDYVCPSPSSQVYLTATGGNPGLSSGTENGALAMMVALGPCGGLTENTFIIVNEVTTVAAVWSLQQFMAGYANVGSTSTNTLGLTRAFTAADAIAGVACGCATGNYPLASAPQIYYPQATLNTLANALAACVNSDGSTTTGTSCGLLFAAATPSGGTAPTDTIGAALNIALHPGSNVSGVFGVSTANAPFQPVLSTPPNDWTVAISYAEFIKFYAATALDIDGNFYWDYYYMGSGAESVSPAGDVGRYININGYNASTFAFDPSNQMWVGVQQTTSSNTPTLFVINSSGAQVAAITPGGTSVPSPAIDSLGNVWVTTTAGLSIYSSTTLSPLVSNFAGVGASGLADGTGGMWSAATSTSLLRSTLSGSTIASTSYTGPTIAPAALAIDATPHLWVLNSNSTLTQLTPGGGVYTASGALSGGGLNSSAGGKLAVDGDGNVWVANYASNNLSEFSNSGVALSPATGYATTTSVPYVGIPAYTQPVINPVAIAVDRSGDVWTLGNQPAFTNDGPYGYTVTDFLGLAAPVATIVSPGVRP